MAFDDEAIALVATFCRHHRVHEGTSFTVVPNFEEALRIAALKGPDNRWKRINARCDAADFPTSAPEHRAVAADRSVYEFLVRRDDRLKSSRPRKAMRPWFLSYIVVSAHHWARFSNSLRQAHELGLGWLVPANKEVLVVPTPTLRFAKGRPGVLHDDSGKKAMEWGDGSGCYVLHGTEFDKGLYLNIINGQLSIEEIGALGNADQRSIALLYLTFEQLVADSHSDLLDTGVKGTSLYRLPLPPPIARDRVPGYGRYDYFIHMRDASHPEREFIEWVDPKIGARVDLFLKQADYVDQVGDRHCEGVLIQHLVGDPCFEVVHELTNIR